MPNRLSQLKDWLLDKRRFRTAWFAKDPQLTPKPEEALAKLPDDVARKLKNAVNQLAVVQCERQQVLDALNEAISQWRENPRLANNSMVVLAHPVSSVARILAESLNDLESQQGQPLKTHLLDWIERPPDVNDIKQQIKKKLGWDEEHFSSEEGLDRTHRNAGGDEETDEETEPKAIAIIPNLSWCFLRSADGLEGIDYLQETLLNDRSQFWIIGSGQVGWEYLKSTLKFHAYCGDTVYLPKLSGKQLREWISPIISEFDIYFSDSALHKRLQKTESLLDMDISTDKPIEAISEITQEMSATMQSSIRAFKNEMLPDTDDDNDDDNNPCSDYFNRLADISDGVSVVALQLFLKSLRYRKITQEDIEEGALSHLSSSLLKDDEPETQHIIATTPKLPPLPDLSQSDLYLLYSLMLHGDLTIRALANSLGDAPQAVNNQIQVLRNADIIEQKNGVVKANPVHYPRLRRELSNNNFIIEVP